MQLTEMKYGEKLNEKSADLMVCAFLYRGLIACSCFPDSLRDNGIIADEGIAVN